jgi:hypothetical protein
MQQALPGMASAPRTDAGRCNGYVIWCTASRCAEIPSGYDRSYLAVKSRDDTQAHHVAAEPFSLR